MKSTCTIPCLNLRQIAESGQCFRMTPLNKNEYPETGDTGYRIISQGRLVNLWQSKEQLTFDCPEEDLPFWMSYFDFETDYEAILSSVSPEDTYLKAAALAGGGIRILRQDPWEMIITFVISQQKTIPKIRELSEALCCKYGSPVLCRDMGDKSRIPAPGSLHDEPSIPALYAFPTPEQLSAATLEELQKLKLGYRAKYIHRLAQDSEKGELDIDVLKKMSYEDAMKYLTGFYGIGKKVANCVCLFGLHHVEAFPVDTWIEKILLEQYYDKGRYGPIPKARLYDKIIMDHFGRYKGCAGIMQQYIFYYERLRSSKIL